MSLETRNRFWNL